MTNGNSNVTKQQEQEENGFELRLYRPDEIKSSLDPYIIGQEEAKKVLSVAVAKSAYIHRLILDIMHRIVTGKSYDLEYRMISADKAKKNAETKIEAAKVNEPETVVVEKNA